ncbi:MAG: type toxin-antitoxin system prevent-host-death family antitoxin [Rubritepida sp.]|nr:type toxin-antitoxin system prevent-host-death family antitoxin [Rubritepida sp.]
MDSTVGAFEAKTHLSALLDRVARGEEVTITRRGLPVAKLVPVKPVATDRGAAVRDLRQFRERLLAEGAKPFTVEEILELRDAGRKY